MSYQVILELPKNSFIRIGRGSGNVRWIRKSIFKSTITPKDTPYNRMTAISILQGWFEREFAKHKLEIEDYDWEVYYQASW